MKQNSGKQLIEKNIRRKNFFSVIKFGGHQKSVIVMVLNFAVDLKFSICET